MWSVTSSDILLSKPHQVWPPWRGGGASQMEGSIYSYRFCWSKNSWRLRVMTSLAFKSECQQQIKISPTWSSTRGSHLPCTLFYSDWLACSFSSVQQDFSNPDIIIIRASNIMGVALRGLLHVSSSIHLIYIHVSSLPSRWLETHIHLLLHVISLSMGHPSSSSNPTNNYL